VNIELFTVLISAHYDSRFIEFVIILYSIHQND